MSLRAQRENRRKEESLYDNSLCMYKMIICVLGVIFKSESKIDSNALIESFSGRESGYDAQLGLAPRWIFVEKSVDMTEG